MLGVRPDASRTEIRAAFRRFAAVHHPDRGGTAARFQAGLDAYRRLTGTPAAAAGNIVFHRRRRVPLHGWWRRRFSSRRQLH